MLSSLIAAWVTPLAIAVVSLPHDLNVVKFPFAVVLGLLTMDVLGRGVIALAHKWIARHGPID